MLIPHEQLEVDTLTRLIEDFVTRDGTDNGDETPLHTRIERVRHALGKGQAVSFRFQPVGGVRLGLQIGPGVGQGGGQEVLSGLHGGIVHAPALQARRRCPNESL